MGVWLFPFIIIAGVLQAAGAVMNAQLRIYLVNPWLASFVSFVLVTFFFASLVTIIPRPLPSAQDLAAMPWWAPLGGLAGAVAVFAGLMFIGKLGAGTVNGIIISANVLTSIVIDHYGIMNTPVHEASIWRILGAAMMAGGIALISRF